MSPATVHRLRDDAAKSAEERARVMQEARDNVTRAKGDGIKRTQYAPHQEDPIRRWRREADEAEEAEREAKRADQLRSKERKQELARQQSDNSEAWEAWLRTRLDNERAYWVEVLGELVAEEQRSRAELEARLKAVENENRELRGLLLEKIADIRNETSRTHAELSRRMAQREVTGLKNMELRLAEAAEMRHKVEVIEKAAGRWLEQIAARDASNPMMWK